MLNNFREAVLILKIQVEIIFPMILFSRKINVVRYKIGKKFTIFP